MKYQIPKILTALVLAVWLMAGDAPVFAANSASLANQSIASFRFDTDPTETASSSSIPLIQIDLNKTEVTVKPGNYTALVVLYTPFNTTVSKNVTWYSTNEAVATVVGNGLVKGIKQGTANIIAQVGNFTASCRVVVGNTESISVIKDDDGDEITVIDEAAKYRELSVNEVDGMRYISITSGEPFPQSALPELTNVRMSRTGNGLICAQWGVSGTADGFEVYASTDGGSTYTYATEIQEMKFYISSKGSEDDPSHYLIIGYYTNNMGIRIYGSWSPVLQVR